MSCPGGSSLLQHGMAWLIVVSYIINVVASADVTCTRIEEVRWCCRLQYRYSRALLIYSTLNSSSKSVCALIYISDVQINIFPQDARVGGVPSGVQRMDSYRSLAGFVSSRSNGGGGSADGSLMDAPGSYYVSLSTDEQVSLRIAFLVFALLMYSRDYCERMACRQLLRRLLCA